MMPHCHVQVLFGSIYWWTLHVVAWLACAQLALTREWPNCKVSDFMCTLCPSLFLVSLCSSYSFTNRFPNIVEGPQSHESVCSRSSNNCPKLPENMGHLCIVCLTIGDSSWYLQCVCLRSSSLLFKEEAIASRLEAVAVTRVEAIAIRFKSSFLVFAQLHAKTLILWFPISLK